jgi:hypothetical protein
MYQIKEKIIELVNCFGPIKETDLVLKISSWVNEDIQNRDFSDWCFYDSLIEAIQDGDIIQLTYLLPTTDSCPNTLYFPKNTEIQVF